MNVSSWKTVVVFGIAAAAIIAMAWLRLDSSTIFELILALGLGGTLGLTSSVHTRVNGNITQLVDTIRDAMNKLSQAPPIPSDNTPPADPPTPPDGS